MITAEKLLMIAAILVGAPSSYIYYFLISELPKKIGYLKFILVCLAYILLIALMIPIIYVRVLGPFIYLAFLLFSPLLGAWYLRAEFIDSLKNLFNRNKE